jgi:hypothetical protein
MRGYDLWIDDGMFACTRVPWILPQGYVRRLLSDLTKMEDTIVAKLLQELGEISCT